MDKKLPVTFSLLASLAVAGAAYAEAPAAGACGDVQWKAEVLAKHPDIAKSCVGVVDRDGRKYVRLSGKVTGKSNKSITVKLDNTESSMTWEPARGETVAIEGKEVAAMSVVEGQALRFYMPLDKVAM